jgi:hypothetical protein
VSQGARFCCITFGLEVESIKKLGVCHKLLVPKFDFFIEYSSLENCNVTKNGRAIDPYYVNINNAHVKNEKLYYGYKDMI